MRLVPQAVAIVLVLACCQGFAPARAQNSLALEPITGFAGVVQGSIASVASRPKSTSSPNAVTIAYDNTSSAANFGVSSTDLTADWGDRLLMAGAGLLSSQRFTIFNSPSSSGALVTARVQMEFFDGPTTALLGSHSVDVDLGTGLNPGFYVIVDTPGLEALLINLPADVIVVQSVVSLTGGADRLGVASLELVTVGSSPTSMYILASTVGGGVPGFYVFPSGPANPGHQVKVSPPSVGTKTRSWGQLKQRYR